VGLGTYFRAAKYDAAGCGHRSFVMSWVDIVNFTLLAFLVLPEHRNEFRGAKVYYFSRILTCARLTFFLSRRVMAQCPQSYILKDGEPASISAHARRSA